MSLFQHPARFATQPTPRPVNTAVAQALMPLCDLLLNALALCALLLTVCATSANAQAPAAATPPPAPATNASTPAPAAPTIIPTRLATTITEIPLSTITKATAAGNTTNSAPAAEATPPTTAATAITPVPLTTTTKTIAFPAPSPMKFAPGIDASAKGAFTAKPVPARRSLEAENQYIAGARAMDKDDPAEAAKDFAKAVRLDPSRNSYAIALGIAVEHHVNQLVQQATDATRNGDAAQATRLLKQARTIDPNNPMVQEHLASLPLPIATGVAPQAAQPAGAAPHPLQAAQPTLQIEPTPTALDPSEESGTVQGAPPPLAGPIELDFRPTPQSFHFRSDVQDLLRRVYSAYGITATFSSSVQPQSVRLDLDNATWQQALTVVQMLTDTFAVPLTPKSVLVVKETQQNRTEYERLAEETVFLPALNAEQMSDMGNLVRLLFGVKQATVQSTGESLAIRAPAATLRAINYTLNDLLDGGGELLLEMHLYEVDRSRTLNVGPTLPQTSSVFNVESEAQGILNSNQSLIAQLIASGAITPGNVLEEIAALIAAGACGSSVLCQPFATFGKGLTATGLGFQGAGFSLALNSSAVRAIDQVQLRVSDHQTANFRNGTKYPIVTSTASYGPIAGSGTTSGLLASLGLSQQQLSALGLGAGANLSALEPAPYPMVQYEDLGLTLKATPIIQRSGDISLHLEMQLEALTGASLDGNPILSSRQVTSDITVREGTSAVLMSAVSKSESNALSGLPFLSELPGFFDTATTNQNNQVDQQELVMVITPHIVRRRKDELASPMVVLPMHAIPSL